MQRTRSFLDLSQQTVERAGKQKRRIKKIVQLPDRTARKLVGEEKERDRSQSRHHIQIRLDWKTVEGQSVRCQQTNHSSEGRQLKHQKEKLKRHCQVKVTWGRSGHHQGEACCLDEKRGLGPEDDKIEQHLNQQPQRSLEQAVSRIKEIKSWTIGSQVDHQIQIRSNLEERKLKQQSLTESQWALSLVRSWNQVGGKIKQRSLRIRTGKSKPRTKN